MALYRARLDESGMPQQYFHYFVVADLGQSEGAGGGATLPVTAARASGMAHDAMDHMTVESGGPATAIAKAEDFLVGRRPGSKTLVSEISDA